MKLVLFLRDAGAKSPCKWCSLSGIYTFLAHGDVDISNNLAENAIRPFVIGRKNWLFCDTPKGAKASAAVYSLVETAKANDLEPFAYLSYILDELRYLGKNLPAAELDALLPWGSIICAKFAN